jgi:hypothetical protein
VGDSLTGGMGGDYTSWAQAFKLAAAISLYLKLSLSIVEHGSGDPGGLQEVCKSAS